MRYNIKYGMGGRPAMGNVVMPFSFLVMTVDLSVDLPLFGLSMNVFSGLKKCTSATGSYEYSGSVLITGVFQDAGTDCLHRPFTVLLPLPVFPVLCYPVPMLWIEKDHRNLRPLTH